MATWFLLLLTLVLLLVLLLLLLAEHLRSAMKADRAKENHQFGRSCKDAGAEETEVNEPEESALREGRSLKRKGLVKEKLGARSRSASPSLLILFRRFVSALPLSDSSLNTAE